MKPIELTRRDFLKLSAVAGGGLLLGFDLQALAATEEAPATASFTPNAWIRIDPDGQVTLQVASSEMGQGIMTGIAMILAEELDADWSRVRAEFAPADKAYFNPKMGRQATGGSTAVRGFWTPLRTAGATAREVLLQAAAQHWGVEAGDCHAAQGEVIHAASGKRLSYGELAGTAAKLPVPDTVFLKESDEFVLLGKPLPRLDTPIKVDGSAEFGMDVRLPGMLTATVARCPTIGGKV
ncbi:MAG: molybdopterin-dependent oxidoreductase, partial [Chromatiales bacterium]